jgi:tetratricopeptide (TPR) repeat protein
MNKMKTLIYIFLIIIFQNHLFSQENSEKIDTSFVSNLNKIARELVSKDNFKSKELLDSAFNYAYKYTSHYWIAYTYQSYGLLNINLDSIVKATDYLELSARAFSDIKYFNDKCLSNLILSDLYYSIGRYEKAIEVLKKSLKDEEKLYVEYIHSIYLKLAENYNKINDNSNSLFYRQMYNSDVETLDFKIELENANAQAINQQSKVHELQIELEIEKLKSNYIIWSFGFVIVFSFIVILILSFKIYKIKKTLT